MRFRITYLRDGKTLTQDVVSFEALMAVLELVQEFGSVLLTVENLSRSSGLTKN